MSALQENPTSLNFLSPLNFKFQIKRAPNVNFFIQSLNIPDITISEEPSTGNPFTRIPYPGDHVTFGELRITFKVDEDLENYLEIHNWLRGLGFSKSFDEYAKLQAENPLLGGGIRSDIAIILMNSTKNPNFEITFTEAFPTYLSGLELNTMDSSVDYLSASASFKYILYDIKKIT